MTKPYYYLVVRCAGADGEHELRNNVVYVTTAEITVSAVTSFARRSSLGYSQLVVFLRVNSRFKPSTCCKGELFGRFQSLLINNWLESVIQCLFYIDEESLGSRPIF
ncbi:hypothetical protein CEXT_627841 [Caerostris extrusa]|uniref:Uncharacterized protein n=1 Tax=Caerostris extrusa TaxID=172846 RepID=A0AAV4XG76_CAEEX|nr:hypothetical protein CEXT_627841 [Caerostris extrusa]